MKSPMPVTCIYFFHHEVHQEHKDFYQLRSKAKVKRQKAKGKVNDAASFTLLAYLKTPAYVLICS
jgi:hypothetical protein